ncbi:unnamed protein product [Cochlearia groenlandica]
MDSNFHYTIDLNKDQNHHEEPFFYPLGSSSSLHHNHQVPSNSSSSISSLSSYLPFLINSQEHQHVAIYNNNNTYHDNHLHLSTPLKDKMFNGGSSSLYDHMVPKKETRVKLTIKKIDHHEDDRTDLLQQNPTKTSSESDKWMVSPKMRLIKKTITNTKHPIDHTITTNNKDDHYLFNHNTNFQENQDHREDLKKALTRKTTARENRYNTIKESGYGNNNGVIRVCSDCSTTKTPLWRSGPQGPKSLCNACGIRQRKARRAAMLAAAATSDQEAVAARLKQLPVKKKLQNKKKRSNGGDKCNVVDKAKKCKIKQEKEEVAMVAIDSSTINTTTTSSILSKKLCLEDLNIMLSKNSSAYQQVFPQDEKEAAVLLMALSYGMVHG